VELPFQDQKKEELDSFRCPMHTTLVFDEQPIKLGRWSLQELRLCMKGYMRLWEGQSRL